MMNRYKIALWIVLALIYIPMFWGWPMIAKTELSYLSLVFVCHMTIIVPIALGNLIGHLHIKSEG